MRLLPSLIVVVSLLVVRACGRRAVAFGASVPRTVCRRCRRDRAAAHGQRVARHRMGRQSRRRCRRSVRLGRRAIDATASSGVASRPASASLSYSLNRATVALGATAGTTARYYPSLDDQTSSGATTPASATSAILGGGFSGQVGASTSRTACASLMPSLFEPRLGDPIDRRRGLSVVPGALPRVFGGARLHAAIVTRRNTFSAALQLPRSRAGAATPTRFDSHGRRRGSHLRGRTRPQPAARVRLLTRPVYGRAVDYGNHVINAGVNYNRALVVLPTDDAFVRNRERRDSRRSRDDSLRFHATGNGAASTTRSAAPGTQRSSTTAVSSSSKPGRSRVFSDSAAAGVGGLFTSRVQLQLTARGAARPTAFQCGDAQPVSRRYGAQRCVTVAVTRHVNTGVTYTYYRHEFADSVAAGAGLPQSVRTAERFARSCPCGFRCSKVRGDLDASGKEVSTRRLRRDSVAAEVDRASYRSSSSRSER